MAAVKPRTITRDEEDPRMPERMPDRDDVIRNRSGQPITLRFSGDEDRFAFDRSIIPPGWDYQWKTRTIKGWEWVDHQVELGANGWEPVPAERHDGIFMPKGYKGTIERGGLILMERDARLTVRARAIDKRKADAPVRESHAMAGLMPRQVAGAATITDFDNPLARGATGVKIAREPRVTDGNYKSTLDE